MLGEVGLPITGCFLLVLIRDDSASIVHPEYVGVCCWAVVVGGGASVAGASGHEKPSVPPWGRTLLALHLYFGMTGWFF